MIAMSKPNAVAIVVQLRDSRTTDIASLEKRIEQLETEYLEDPWEGTFAQIKRLRLRLIHYRLDAEALTIMLEDK